ncbi:hypothetical protein MTO96_034932 [Rhipicephalus appendiculatus]
MASLDIKIKKLTRATEQKDAFRRKDVRLVTVIRTDCNHMHRTQSADDLRLLRPTTSTREAFLRYTDDGMTPIEARRLHESKLHLEDNCSELFASEVMRGGGVRRELRETLIDSPSWLKPQTRGMTGSWCTGKACTWSAATEKNVTPGTMEDVYRHSRKSTLPLQFSTRQAKEVNSGESSLNLHELNGTLLCSVRKLPK